MSTDVIDPTTPTARQFQAHSVVSMTPQYGQQLLLSVLAHRDPEAVLGAMKVVEARREAEYRLVAAEKHAAFFAAAAAATDDAVRRLVDSGDVTRDQIADMAGMSEERLQQICDGGRDLTFGEVWVLADVLGLDLSA